MNDRLPPRDPRDLNARDVQLALDEPSDETGALNELSSSLVQHLFSAARTVHVHDLTNRAAQRAVMDLMKPLGKLLETEGRITLRIANDFLILNDVRLPGDSHNQGPHSFLIEEMKKRDVEAIDFNNGIHAEETGRFLKCFFGDVPDGEVFDLVRETLKQVGVEHVALTQWIEREKHLADSSQKKVTVREDSNRVFFRSVALMGEILKGIEQRRAIQFHKAERLTQQMVDIIQADESILIGLASIKNFDEYTFAHSVNVCILSMLIADRLRLYKSDTARLGVAALLHDIGKTYIPQTILNRPGELADADWELMKYHTFFGVKELSRIKGLREIADSLFVALQHHVHFNMDGYPQKPGGWDLRLFTRIVTVADYYDAMTTPRIYATRPLTPDRALSFILHKSGEVFDPFIAKVFIQVMGMYPVGTVVELDDGARCVVVRQNRGAPMMHRPIVARLDASNDATSQIDLSEKGSGGRRGYARSIRRALYDEDAERAKATRFIADA